MTKDWIEYLQTQTEPVEDQEYFNNDECSDEFFGLKSYKDHYELWA